MYKCSEKAFLQATLSYHIYCSVLLKILQILQNMEKHELIGLGARIVQTLATNASFGAALYINIVETPAKLALPSSDAMLDHFQATFPRAKNMMRRIGMVGMISGLTGTTFQMKRSELPY